MLKYVLIIISFLAVLPGLMNGWPVHTFLAGVSVGVLVGMLITDMWGGYV